MANKLNIPIGACSFEVGKFSFGDNGENAKTAPLSMVALSGEPLDHWFFGPCIQDLSGMTHANRITVDYNHDSYEIIGYVNKFNTDGGNLELGGALIPFKDNDRATEIIHKSRAGVPYQSSIYFPPSKPGELKIQQVDEGEQVEVNGKMYDGPMTVFRQWTLRGVAVCPYGADSGTATHVQSDKSQTVEAIIMDEKKEEAVEAAQEEKEEVVEAEAEKVEVETDAEKTEEAVEPEVEKSDDEEEAIESEEEEEKQSDNRDEFRQFVEEFGAVKASDFYAQGLSIEDSRKQFNADLKKENEELQAKVAKQQAVEFEPADDEQAEKVTLAWCVNHCKATGSDPQKLYEALNKKDK